MVAVSAHSFRYNETVTALIVVDAMGGDYAPDAIVKGVAAASNDVDARLVLVGDPVRIRSILDSSEHRADRIEILQADGAIAMDATPREALAAQPQASLPVAARFVAATPESALVSAGNTGAVILACAEAFPRIRGIPRAALAAVVPTERRRGEKDDPFSLILDVGATVRARTEDLVGFALMGSAYAEIISRNQRPRVALLSNGSEPNKGTDEIVAAHARLSTLPNLEFIGNVEGVDIPRGTADVVICDGFTGNIVLKMLEGVSETVMNLARFAYRESLQYKVAIALLSKGIKELKGVTDWQQYGGAPILGFERPCIKAHGRSSDRAIKNAVKVAARCIAQDLPQLIQHRMAETPARRSIPPGA
ncbi:MAG: phosphate acyltransferase PlsX [Deltaproteobacteria bacterium]|nr:phosphate acyltransferase PlsX [Deltaproteobacteria bacterium]